MDERKRERNHTTFFKTTDQNQQDKKDLIYVNQNAFETAYLKNKPTFYTHGLSACVAIIRLNPATGEAGFAHHAPMGSDALDRVFSFPAEFNFVGYCNMGSALWDTMNEIQ